MDLIFSEIRKKTIIESKIDVVLESKTETKIEPVDRIAGSIEGLVYDTIPESNIIKNRVIKLKIIVFDELGKDPLSNYNDLRERDKKRFLDIIKKYDSEKTDEEIDKLFNEICIETIFDYRKVDYSTLPIYSA
jgi:hypothetical protein